MKQQNIVLSAILLVTCLLVGTLANEDSNSVFQRRLDIDDDSPLTRNESRFLTKLIDLGIVTGGEDTVAVSAISANTHRALKGSKSSKKEKKVPEESDQSSTGGRLGAKLAYIPASTIARGNNSTHGFGKGGKGKSSKKTSKKCKKWSSSKGKGKGKGGSKSSKKSSKGYCAHDSVELLPLTIFFGHENATSMVVPTGLTEFDWGTIYTYDGKTFMAHHRSPIITNTSTGVLTSDYSSYTIMDDDVIGNVTGRCTRIDPNDQASSSWTGTSYCEFSYAFRDSDGYTHLTAEGVLPSSSSSGVLAVTGGTGVFRRVVGQLIVTPKAGADSATYLEVFGNLWLDSRVVDSRTYGKLTATS